MLLQGAMQKVRNRVAGYIARVSVGIQTSPSNESTEEIE